jgi:hypothetical protein
MERGGEEGRERGVWMRKAEKKELGGQRENLSYQEALCSCAVLA